MGHPVSCRIGGVDCSADSILDYPAFSAAVAAGPRAVICLAELVTHRDTCHFGGGAGAGNVALVIRPAVVAQIGPFGNPCDCAGINLVRQAESLRVDVQPAHQRRLCTGE